MAEMANTHPVIKSTLCIFSLCEEIFIENTKMTNNVIERRPAVHESPSDSKPLVNTVETPSQDVPK